MNREEHAVTSYGGHINNYLFELIPAGKKVLDIGCNTGNLGKKLITEKKCQVYGVDYSKKAIEIAKKRLTEVMFFDLETDELPFSDHKFDIIIFGDVLEHLRSPESILSRIPKILNKNGLVVASIPNIANINMRLNLLFGKWNYCNDGILDLTHLRFFTKKTIKELFKNSGYEITKIDSTPGSKFMIFRYFKFLTTIAKSMCKIYPNLFALQFIIVARKR